MKNVLVSLPSFPRFSDQLISDLLLSPGTRWDSLNSREGDHDGNNVEDDDDDDGVVEVWPAAEGVDNCPISEKENINIFPASLLSRVSDILKGLKC